MPVISVIVPVYKVEPYIHKCIDSILAQTFTDFELILVDDGSPDCCPAICDEYAKKDERVKVIHKANGGQSSARNVALDMATGAYITFIDSDDYIMENMLARLHETAVAYNADIVSCNIYRKDVSESDLFYKEFSLQTKEESIQEYIIFKKHCGPCSKLYKRHIFDTIRYPDLRAYEDTYIWPDILNLTNTVAHLPDRLYVYNIRDGSITNSPYSPKHRSLLDVALHIQAFVREHYPELYDYVKYDYICALYSIMFRITASFQLPNFREDYSYAFSKFKEELKKFRKDHSALIRKYRLVARCPITFKLRAYMVGMKTLKKKL